MNNLQKEMMMEEAIASAVLATDTPDIELIVNGTKIAQLRQWLNEREQDKMVTNEDIIHWLK